MGRGEPEVQKHPQFSAGLIGNDIVSYIHFIVGNEPKLNIWKIGTQAHRVKATLINGTNGMY